MKLSIALLAAAAPALASGKRLKGISPDTDLSNVQIHAQSKAGNRLLSKARRLDNGDDATTWVAGYSLKFHSCTSSQDYYGGQFANNDGDNANNYNYQYNGDNNGDNNGQYNQDGQYDANAYGDNGDGNNYNGNGYYNNEERNDYQGMYAQKVVHFKLCPSDSCFRCKNGADYVVELSEFVDAYLESKMTSLEYNCERVRENCWCENANSKEQCEYGCYQNANMQECADAMVEQDEDAFDVQEAVECSQLEVDEEAVENYYLAQNYYSTGYNQNGNYNQNGQGGQDEDHKVYVGPYCSKNGKSIHLGLFSEETCSFPAPDGLYEAINYGSSLPYAKKSMVNSGCITCKAPSENDNQNQNYYENQEQEADEVADVCSSLYEVAGKCEEGLDGYFPYRDVSGCGYIKSLKESALYIPQVNVTAKVFAGIFAVTTAAFGSLAFVLYRRSQRQNVSLAGSAIIS